MVRIERAGMPKKNGTKRCSFGTFWHIFWHFFALFYHFFAFFDTFLSLLKDPAPITPIVKSNWCCGLTLFFLPILPIHPNQNLHRKAISAKESRATNHEIRIYFRPYFVFRATSHEARATNYQPIAQVFRSKNQIFQYFFNCLAKNELWVSGIENRGLFSIKCACSPD